MKRANWSALLVNKLANSGDVMNAHHWPLWGAKLDQDYKEELPVLHASTMLSIHRHPQGT